MEISIQAATIDELNDKFSDWVFIDIGFSENSKSCGALFNSGSPEEMKYDELVTWLIRVIESGTAPLNLVIEAPLSVAFKANGNPTGRSVERRGSATRYWYVGLGSTVMVAATYLLRTITELKSSRKVRLVEGFASFKPKGVPSSHANDVIALRAVAFGESPELGKVIPPSKLKRNPADTIRSAFDVSGMNLGIPPVVALGS